MFAHIPRPRPFRERWFADAAPYVLARALWLRALGLIFLSAFYSLWFQIHGLIGPNGILPAREHLSYAREVVGAKAYWLIPSLLWLNSGRGALTAIVVIGGVASVAIVFNVFTRTAIAMAAICFLSFVAAAQPVVPDLLRVRPAEDPQRRAAVARPHGHSSTTSCSRWGFS